MVVRAYASRIVTVKRGNAEEGTHMTVDKRHASPETVANTDDQLLRSFGYAPQLRRALGFISSFCMQFTVVAVAAGLLLTFGTGFTTSGPLLMPAWLVGGGLQMVVALAVAVAVSALPFAGGPFQIISKLGFPKLGWVSGLLLIVGVIAAMAGEAVGLVPYYASYFGLDASSSTAVLVGAGIIIVVGAVVNLAGVKVAAFINNGAVVAEGAAILIVVAGLGGLLIFKHNDFQSPSFLVHSAGIIPEGTSPLLPFLFTMLVPVFVVSGFYANGTAGEETRHASRTVPKALWTSALASVVLGAVMLLLVLLGVKDAAATADSAAPMTFILEGHLGAVPSKIFEVLAVLALTVNLILLQLASARMLWAFSRDRAIPAASFFGKLNGNQVPITATVTVTIIGVLFCAWTSLLNILMAVSVVLSCLPIAFMLSVVLRQRRRHPLLQEPAFNLGSWTGPLTWIGTLWTFFLCAVLMYQEPLMVGLSTVVCIALAAVLCVLSGQMARPAESAPTPSSTTVSEIR